MDWSPILQTITGGAIVLAANWLAHRHRKNEHVSQRQLQAYLDYHDFLGRMDGLGERWLQMSEVDRETELHELYRLQRDIEILGSARLRKQAEQIFSSIEEEEDLVDWAGLSRKFAQQARKELGTDR